MALVHEQVDPIDPAGGVAVEEGHDVGHLIGGPDVPSPSRRGSPVRSASHVSALARANGVSIGPGQMALIL